MPKVPTIEAKLSRTTQTSQVQRDVSVAGANGRTMQQIGAFVDEQANKFYEISSMREQMKVREEADNELNLLIQERENDLDLTPEKNEEYLSRAKQIRDNALGSITGTINRMEFQSDADALYSSASQSINSDYKKKIANDYQMRAPGQIDSYLTKMAEALDPVTYEKNKSLLSKFLTNGALKGGLNPTFAGETQKNIDDLVIQKRFDIHMDTLGADEVARRYQNGEYDVKDSDIKAKMVKEIDREATVQKAKETLENSIELVGIQKNVNDIIKDPNKNFGEKKDAIAKAKDAGLSPAAIKAAEAFLGRTNFAQVQSNKRFMAEMVDSVGLLAKSFDTDADTKGMIKYLKGVEELRTRAMLGVVNGVLAESDMTEIFDNIDEELQSALSQATGAVSKKGSFSYWGYDDAGKYFRQNASDIGEQDEAMRRYFYSVRAEPPKNDAERKQRAHAIMKETKQVQIESLVSRQMSKFRQAKKIAEQQGKIAVINKKTNAVGVVSKDKFNAKTFQRI